MTKNFIFSKVERIFFIGIILNLIQKRRREKRLLLSSLVLSSVFRLASVKNNVFFSAANINIGMQTFNNVILRRCCGYLNKWWHHRRIICASLTNNQVIIWHSIILIRHFCKCCRNQLNRITNCEISFVLIAMHCLKSKTNFLVVRSHGCQFASFISYLTMIYPI